MSPLHHHYELVGWSEWRVVVTFWSVGLIISDTRYLYRGVVIIEAN